MRMREGYKLTELGEIPVEWEVKKVGEVFYTVTDYVANGSFASLRENVNYKDEEDYAVLIRLTDYNNNFEGPFVYVDKKAYDFLSKSKLVSGDIIIANVGAYAGFVFKAKEINKPMTLGPNAILVRSNESSDFLFYWLQSKYGQEGIKSIISTTAQPKFNKTDFKTILLPIPNLKEQQKIADILSTVDKQIENTESLIEKIKELKKGLMQRLLTKGIGHTEFKETEVGVIPKEWEVKKAGDVFHTITDYVANGSFASLRENVNYKDEEDYAVLIRLTDYNNNFEGPFIYVDKKAYDFLSKSKLVPEDIIIANVGAYAGFVFKAKEINKPMTLGPNAILVRSNYNQNYLYYWLQSEIGQTNLKNIISTTAQPKFNKTDFRTLIILIPPLMEQEKIAQILLEVDVKIDQYETQKTNLLRLKQALMQKLLTGKIRVKV
jgi:type I restriction enzyme, S subunit